METDLQRRVRSVLLGVGITLVVISIIIVFFISVSIKVIIIDNGGDLISLPRVLVVGIVAG